MLLYQYAEGAKMLVLIYAINHIIEAVLMYYYATKLYGHARTPIREFTGTVLCYSAMFLIFLKHIVWLNVLSNLLFPAILILYLTKCRLWNACFNSILFLNALLISEQIFMLITNTLLWGYGMIATQNKKTMIITTWVEKLFFIILILTIVRIRKHRLNDAFYPMKMNISILAIVLLCLFALFTLQDIETYIKLTRIQSILVILSGITVFLITLITVWIFDESQRRHKHLMELQLQGQLYSDAISYNKAILEHDNEQRIMIHDIRNHLTSLNLINTDPQNQKVSDYISGLLDSPALNKKTVYTQNTILSILINRYKQRCEDYNIPFFIDITNASLDFMTPEDTTSLFCNIMDNALDAASLSDTKQNGISVLIKNSETSGTTIFSVENDCQNEPNLSSDGIPISTKADPEKHGWGMKSIKTLATKSRGEFITSYDPQNKIFNITVILGSIAPDQTLNNLERRI